MKYSLGWVEVGLYLAGVALLSTFLVLRFEGERQRAAGIAAFEQVAGSAVASISQPGASSSPLLRGLAPPDQALWAEKRIREYEESLKADAAPPLAVVRIDTLDIEVPVYDGADDFNLNRGVARITGTARVGEAGNLGIAGHRDGFFRGLKDITVGDRIDLQTLDGSAAYRVSSIEIVNPEDVWVLAPTEEPSITLVTCYPFYHVGHAPQRYIVKATAEHFPGEP